MKCDNCLNARSVVSENGIHRVCCLSENEALSCLIGKENYYVGVINTVVDTPQVDLPDTSGRS